MPSGGKNERGRMTADRKRRELGGRLRKRENRKKERAQRRKEEKGVWKKGRRKKGTWSGEEWKGKIRKRGDGLRK